MPVSVRSPVSDRVERRAEEQDEAVDPERGQSGARRRVDVEPSLLERGVDGHQKPRGITPGVQAGVACDRNQLTQARMQRRNVDPIADTASELSHLGTEGGDHDGWRRIGPQEARRVPEATHLLHARLYLRPAYGIGRHGTSDRLLLSSK